jgi:hypothetical protein
MSKKGYVALASMGAALTFFVTAAWGATNNLSPHISVTSGPTVHCGGSNSISPAGTKEKKVLVSYVCQRYVGGVWRDIGTAPASSCNDCAGTGYHETTVGCGTLGNGSWRVRAQVDGYFIDYQNVRHDAATRVTGYYTVSC